MKTKHQEYFKNFEIVTEAQDLNPLVAVTRLHTNASGNYDVWLPATNAMGQKKIIQLIDNTAGNDVTVYFPNAENGNSYDRTLSVMGDTLVLYSTPKGWHVFYRENWY